LIRPISWLNLVLLKKPQRSGDLLFEQLRERLTGIRRRTGRSLALDYSSGGEQFAGVSCVLVHYSCGDRFTTTFEVCAGIEVVALTTGVEVGVALWTRAVEPDGRWHLCTARGALHRFAKRHHLWRAGSFTVDRL